MLDEWDEEEVEVLRYEVGVTDSTASKRQADRYFEYKQDAFDSACCLSRRLNKYTYVYDRFGRYGSVQDWLFHPAKRIFGEPLSVKERKQ